MRFVDWDATKQRMANLVANNPKISGEFTEDALAQLKELEGEAGFEDMGLDELEQELADTIGVFAAEEVPAPGLQDGDRLPFRQMTFTVHDEQHEEIETAIAKAKEMGGGESAVNENSNGNSLAWICERFNRG